MNLFFRFTLFVCLVLFCLCCVILLFGFDIKKWYDRLFFSKNIYVYFAHLFFFFTKLSIICSIYIFWKKWFFYIIWLMNRNQSQYESCFLNYAEINRGSTYTNISNYWSRLYISYDKIKFLICRYSFPG